MTIIKIKIKIILIKNDFIKNFIIKVNNSNNENNYKILMITIMILIMIKNNTQKQTNDNKR